MDTIGYLSSRARSIERLFNCEVESAGVIMIYVQNQVAIKVSPKPVEITFCVLNEYASVKVQAFCLAVKI